jgi:GxxExxY protein
MLTTVPTEPMNLEDDQVEGVISKILACAAEVHRGLGSGLQDIIYHRAFSMELHQAGLIHSRKFSAPILYRDEHIGTQRTDFLIEDTVMVEIKVVPKLDELHQLKAMDYLHQYYMVEGLMLNFGTPSLTFNRVMKPERKIS